MLEKFDAYQLAVRLYRSVDQLDGQGWMRDQVQRACLSVVLNLAEGSARPTPVERRRYYGISLASLREVQAVLELRGERGALWELSDRLGGMLYRLSRPRI
jgi:four helix bundle protein